MQHRTRRERVTPREAAIMSSAEMSEPWLEQAVVRRGLQSANYISRKGSSATSLAICDRKFESATPTSRTPFGGGNTDRIRSKAT